MSGAESCAGSATQRKSRDGAEGVKPEARGVRIPVGTPILLRIDPERSPIEKQSKELARGTRFLKKSEQVWVLRKTAGIQGAR